MQTLKGERMSSRETLKSKGPDVKSLFWAWSDSEKQLRTEPAGTSWYDLNHTDYMYIFTTKFSFKPSAQQLTWGFFKSVKKEADKWVGMH